MSGTKRLALLLPVCVLIGFSAALAGDAPPISIENVSGVGPVVHLAAKFVNPESRTEPTPHPRPLDPQPTIIVGRPGPAASGVNAFSTGMGGALMAARGGSMSTPKQQANRTIQKLIRSLD